ncbi:hypothetical protein ACXR0O_25155 [Verrucomicrobiota bacterium sgz303538]
MDEIPFSQNVDSECQTELRTAAVEYFSSGTSTALENFLMEWPQGIPLCGHDYPEAHRICDIRLMGRPFRLVRCAVCVENLSLYEVRESAFGPSSGVPFWLKGACLNQWITDERRNLQDEEDDLAPI